VASRYDAPDAAATTAVVVLAAAIELRSPAKGGEPAAWYVRPPSWETYAVLTCEPAAAPPPHTRKRSVTPEASSLAISGCYVHGWVLAVQSLPSTVAK
jgi:hypothetical protein